MSTLSDKQKEELTERVKSCQLAVRVIINLMHFLSVYWLERKKPVSGFLRVCEHVHYMTWHNTHTTTTRICPHFIIYIHSRPSENWLRSFVWYLWRTTQVNGLSWARRKVSQDTARCTSRTTTSMNQHTRKVYPHDDGVIIEYYPHSVIRVHDMSTINLHVCVCTAIKLLFSIVYTQRMHSSYHVFIRVRMHARPQG